ncbi:MAG: hypothetical protein WBZ20_01550, partial [Nitrososphaeraceae archaeon]
IVEETHFTHMRRRILKIKPFIEEMGFENDDDCEPIIMIVDASGLIVSKKGDYIEEKWIRKKKEFVKLHITVDAKSKKVVSFRITIYMISIHYEASFSFFYFRTLKQL